MLDFSQTGGPAIFVDAEKYLDGAGQLGRINEDIHANNSNSEFDVGGITYTTGMVRAGSEFLTTYGDKYRWDHVVEIGLRRLREDLIEYFPDVLANIPTKLAELKESNPLHGWIKSLV